MDIKKRRSDRCTRSQLRSPGRPAVANRHQRAMFWEYVAAGMSSEAAAVKAGASQPVGSRWFREAGGMPPAEFRRSAEPLSSRYLSMAEREEIALLLVLEHGVREISRRLSRAASTISREIRRNAATRSGNFEYRGTTAQWHAERAARRPKVAKLAANDTLRHWVEERLSGVVAKPGDMPVTGPTVSWKGRRHGPRKNRRWSKAWSPEQIARRLPLDFRMTTACASVTKPFIRRYLCKGAAPCVVNLPHACAADGLCACRGHVSASAEKASCRPRS